MKKLFLEIGKVITLLLVSSIQYGGSIPRLHPTIYKYLIDENYIVTLDDIVGIDLFCDKLIETNYSVEELRTFVLYRKRY